MKKILPIALLICSTTTVAAELHSFDKVKEAVVSGKNIRIAVNFTKCSNSPSSKYRFGVYTPNAVVADDEQVAASLTHFTVNDPMFPTKPVYQFVRYTFTANDAVKVTAQVLDAASYAPLTPVVPFSCQLDHGVKVYVS